LENVHKTPYKADVRFQASNCRPDCTEYDCKWVLISAGKGWKTVRTTSQQTSAEGAGRFLLIHDRLHLNPTYAGFSSAAVAAYIHGPADTSQAAGIMVDLEPFNTNQFGHSGSFAGSVSLTPEQPAALVDQLTYVNIHTGTSLGKARGQIPSGMRSKPQPAGQKACQASCSALVNAGAQRF
jgi:hypothetical protein